MTERAGIEIIGMISTTLASEIYGKSIITGAVDPGFIARFARAHEEGGFDRARGGDDDAARLPDRPPSRVRRADPGRA